MITPKEERETEKNKSAPYSDSNDSDDDVEINFGCIRTMSDQ